MAIVTQASPINHIDRLGALLSNTSLQQLQQQLEKSGSDYVIDEQIDDSACRLRFTGTFDGQPVVWHACIQTLKSYALENLSTTPGTPVRLRQFIDISDGPHGYDIHVGLNLDKIDKAALLRTIIMVRKYKRLHTGRHEYGEWIEF